MHPPFNPQNLLLLSQNTPYPNLHPYYTLSLNKIFNAIININQIPNSQKYLWTLRSRIQTQIFRP